MLGEILKGRTDRLMSGLTSRLAGGGVRPGVARVGEIVSACACAACLALGLKAAGLALLVVHVFFDYLDGALKRAGAREPFLDAWGAEKAHAVTDKAAEATIFAGIGFGDWAQWWSVAVALVTSLAATLSGVFSLRLAGVRRETSFFDRTDRMFLLLLSIAANRVQAGLLAIVVINCVIIAERIVKALRR